MSVCRLCFMFYVGRKNFQPMHEHIVIPTIPLYIHTHILCILKCYLNSIGLHIDKTSLIFEVGKLDIKNPMTDEIVPVSK